MEEQMIQVGAFEAKTRLSELLELVRRGARVTITRHDRPVACLVGHDTVLAERRAEAAAALRRLRGRYRLGRLNARTLREEGRP